MFIPFKRIVLTSGAGVAVLRRADTGWTAKLIDVHPDGMAVNLTCGILRARYRDGYENSELITPVETYEYTIKLNPTGNVFLPGHRIRLDGPAPKSFRQTGGIAPATAASRESPSREKRSAA